MRGLAYGSLQQRDRIRAGDADRAQRGFTLDFCLGTQHELAHSLGQHDARIGGQMHQVSLRRTHQQKIGDQATLGRAIAAIARRGRRDLQHVAGQLRLQEGLRVGAGKAQQFEMAQRADYCARAGGVEFAPRLAKMGVWSAVCGVGDLVPVVGMSHGSRIRFRAIISPQSEENACCALASPRHHRWPPC